MALVERLFSVLVIVFLIVQWAIPGMLGKPTFPMFRRKSTNLLNEMAELKQSLQDDKTEAEVLRLRKQHQEEQQKLKGDAK